MHAWLQRSQYLDAHDGRDLQGELNTRAQHVDAVSQHRIHGGCALHLLGQGTALQSCWDVCCCAGFCKVLLQEHDHLRPL